MAKRRPKSRTPEVVTPDSSESTKMACIQVDREEITGLAHQLWIERGCPNGTPDEDWFRAEAELRSRASRPRQTSDSV